MNEPWEKEGYCKDCGKKYEKNPDEGLAQGEERPEYNPYSIDNMSSAEGVCHICKGIWLKPNLRERKVDGGETVELCPDCMELVSANVYRKWL
jgi:hypothetical protein